MHESILTLDGRLRTNLKKRVGLKTLPAFRSKKMILKIFF